MSDKYQNYGPGTIANLLDKNELEGHDLFNCIYRAVVLLREMANKTNAEPISTTGQMKKGGEDVRGTSREAFETWNGNRLSNTEKFYAWEAWQAGRASLQKPGPNEETKIRWLELELASLREAAHPQGAAPIQPNIAHRLTDAELADPEYVRAYVDECFEALEEMKGAAPIQSRDEILEEAALLIDGISTHEIPRSYSKAIRALKGNPSSSQKPLLAADDKPLNTNVRATVGEEDSSFDSDIETIVNTLRGFDRAYPEDIFQPLDAETFKAIVEAYPGAIDRISANMGRHCGKFMAQGANTIEALQRALAMVTAAQSVAADKGEASHTDRPCIINPISSRTCERGRRCCVVHHTVETPLIVASDKPSSTVIRATDSDGWISVKDRLPKPEVSVLIAMADGRIEKTCWYNGEFLRASSEQPTHWIPLPAHPTKAQP